MKRALRLLHQRDLYLRLEFIVGVIVVLIVGVAAIVSGAEPTLLDAAERGDRAVALRMIASGANVNTPGPDGTTAVMYAAANDDVELVRALIKAGANVKL